MLDSNTSALNQKENDDYNAETKQEQILESLSDDDIQDQIITDLEKLSNQALIEELSFFLSPECTLVDWQGKKDQYINDAKDNILQREL